MNSGEQFADALFGENLNERAAELAQKKIESGIARAQAVSSQILSTGMGKGPQIANEIYDLILCRLKDDGVNADAIAGLALATIPIFQQIRDTQGLGAACQVLAGFTMIIEGGIIADDERQM